MNSLILACLLYLVCSVVGALGSEGTDPPGLVQETESVSSGEGLLKPAGDHDDNEEEDSEVYPMDPLQPASGKKERKLRSKERRNKQRNKSTTTTTTTTTFDPEHSSYTSDPPRSASVTVDPCTSTHLGFCIHGWCKFMEDLQEPVCMCMKGFDGLRCGIQTLEIVSGEDKSEAELVQTVLIIIAVVLSVISCTAILLMTCAHYRTHKNFMAAYLGTGAEVEKLQKPIAHVMV